MKVKEKPKPKYYGTVTPYPNFNASSDASILQSAIESKKVDEDVIGAILAKRNNEQRQKIKAVYESSFGKNLVESLKPVLRSHLEDVVLALLMPPAQFDAYLLRRATQGLGTDEDVLVEVLATRSYAEIQEIKKVFKQEYQKELEEVIKEETGGDFTTALLAMLNTKRDQNTVVDMELAKRDAKILFEAGEGIGKANVSTFINILTTRSGPQLSKSESQESVDCWVSPGQTGGAAPTGDRVTPGNQNFQLKLHLVHFLPYQGHGTSDQPLIRILVSRSEVDLQKVVEEYRAMFERTLHEDILNDTKGHYQKVLLALCGPS
uniref:Annexin n=1 Tax=Xiphophorus couchianus TaxID=32473 RepID=A0A3B5LHR9_9TELE